MNDMRSKQKSKRIDDSEVKRARLALSVRFLCSISHKFDCSLKTQLLLVWLVCLLSIESIATDYVFVVDTSGSMTQAISRKDRRIRITTVQEAMRNYLNAIPADSRATLISFNTGTASRSQ